MAPLADSANTLPLPPDDLREFSGKTSLEDPNFEYLVLGAVHKELIEDILGPDWSWEGKGVLDFGCGAGRVLRHFAPEASLGEFAGCDIHAESIEWASRELSPPFSFSTNGSSPPLPYPDASFDLIYGVSVFTHLTDSWADWLLEMHRLLRPDGRLFLTFLGRGIVPTITGEDWDPNSYGANFAMIGNPWPEGGPAVFHSPWWIKAHWGRLFAIDEMRDSPGEDFPEHGNVLLRKDDRPVPSREDLLRAEPEEPREISALRKNVADLQKETLAAKGEAEQLRAELTALRRQNDELSLLARDGETPPLRPSFRTSWIRAKYGVKARLLKLKESRRAG